MKEKKICENGNKKSLSWESTFEDSYFWVLRENLVPATEGKFKGKATDYWS